MNKRNYQKELDQVLEQLCTDKEETAPTLLLHSCCAPCSSYVLEYLSRYFRITVLYYNPNIYPESEYHNRVQEQMRLIRELPTVIQWIFWRVIIFQPIFITVQKEWKRSQRAANGALPATASDLQKQSARQKKRAVTMLPQPCRSVR